MNWGTKGFINNLRSCYLQYGQLEQLPEQPEDLDFFLTIDTTTLTIIIPITIPTKIVPALGIKIISIKI